MSTKSQQFLVLAALAFAASSCSSAPETTSPETAGAAPTPPAAVEQPGHVLESCDEADEPVAPAPLAESEAPPARTDGAVIHRRPPVRIAPKPTPNTDAIEPLRHRATAARERFEFGAAARMFRALRDHEATPAEQRAAFHAALGEAEDLDVGIREIRRALDSREYALATRRYRVLSIRHPGVPLAMLLDLPDSIRMPGATVPTPGR